MARLLDALFRNESGGRNIANTTQGTSSGQAQGYFQITTGTWNEFGGGRYAPTPLQASYEQQADIASKIPLKRWDESTVALMHATGKPIDTNRTLGENLAANGENIQEAPRVSGPIDAAGGGLDLGATQLYRQPQNNWVQNNQPEPFDDSAAFEDLLASRPEATPDQPRSLLADDMTTAVGRSRASGGMTPSAADDSAPLPTLDFASATPENPPSPAKAGATEVSGDRGLADLFKVKDVGLANRTDPRTGMPRLLRTRRTYG